MTRKEANKNKAKKKRRKNIEMPSCALIKARPCVEIVVSARYAPSATSNVGEVERRVGFFKAIHSTMVFFLFLFFFFFWINVCNPLFFESDRSLTKVRVAASFMREVNSSIFDQLTF